MLEAPYPQIANMIFDKMQHPVCMLSGSMSHRLKVTRFLVIWEDQVV